MKSWADYSFVIRSKHRKRVFELLDKPKTPSQLAEELKLNIGFISNILISLINRSLIKCLNPNEKRHRLYVRTEKGETLIKEIGNY